ncbi:MAG: hypothetical protein EOP52_13860 [Sphingobacteriales bacterium]|nr:MAG: hypothetical protein EOP52_13860 [Sphingobacteriales bacterium]
MSTVTQTLAAIADERGERYEVFIRYGEHEGNVVVDLGRNDDKVALVTAEGWEIVDDHPTKFHRPNGMLPLPLPERGGLLKEFQALMQLPDDVWHLLLAHLIASVNPRGPYLILMLEGDHGSGKTLLCKFLRQLIDPHAVPVITLSGDDRDLMVTAEGNWLLNFDNLSSIRRDLSDALCRLATGGGFMTRKLYSDSDRQIFRSTRPMIMNGITAYATNADLRDRAVFVHLPALAEDKRLTERALEEAFEAMRPRLLGAILDIISAAIRFRPGTVAPTSLRMTDCAHWIQAAERSLDIPAGALVSAIKASQTDKADEFSAMDEVYQQLLAFLCMPPFAGGTPRKEFTGTIGELKSYLDIEGMSFSMQQRIGTPKAFSDYLKRGKKEWLALGLGIDFGNRGKDGRKVRICLTPEALGIPKTLAIVEVLKDLPPVF